MSDIDVIHAIEKQIEEPLGLCDLETVMSGNSRCSYVLDQQQQVIGLNLQNCKQTDLTLIKHFKNLSRLNLSLNQISQLAALKSLENLTQLNLQKNSITDILPLKELSNLTLLNLQDNQITDLKPLKELNNLAVLNVQANQISELRALAKLSELTLLNLSSNLIKELTPLKYLKKLNNLNLSSNQITEIDPLAELDDLLEIDLRFNQITKLQPLNNLKKLTHLYLSTNKVIELDSLKNLQSLTQLYLSSNQINDISPLKELNGLIELDLRSNQISKIDALANLKQLNWLYLENNQITDITPLESLAELIQLNLRNNQIINIEAVKNLKNLTQLYLSNNKIQLLPKWIVDFNLKIKWNSGGDGISVIANPLKYPPPEIIRQGNTAIKAYFETLENQQQRALNEVKVCFVGDSGVGKTSLIKSLCDEFILNEPLTDGITLIDWRYQNITAHCWDFGGDEKIRPLHSLFFSSQCVYVLVLDNRLPRHEEYWLKKIQHLAGNVPVLIVLNKCEQSESYDVNRRNLLKSYQNLQAESFFSVSCTQRLGLEEFKEGLITALKQINLLKKQWPENWIQVKSALARQLNQKYYVSNQFYLELCEKHGVKEKVNQEQLLESLNNIGAFIRFKKNNNLETYILDPNWIAKSLFKIIFSSRISESKGVLELKDLPVILKPAHEKDYCYFVEQYRDLIYLMRNLELCFLIDKNTALMPQLLQNQEYEYEVNQDNILRFRIYYEYLDESVISRLIVVLHEDIIENKYWRTGVLLKNKMLNTSALIKVDYVEHLIIIQVSGKNSRQYFGTIRRILSNIEATLTN
jgi:internalin A